MSMHIRGEHKREGGEFFVLFDVYNTRTPTPDAAATAPLEIRVAYLLSVGEGAPGVRGTGLDWRYAEETCGQDGIGTSSLRNRVADSTKIDTPTPVKGVRVQKVEYSIPPRTHGNVRLSRQVRARHPDTPPLAISTETKNEDSESHLPQTPMRRDAAPYCGIPQL